MIISPVMSETELRVRRKIQTLALESVSIAFDKHVGDSFPEAEACGECRVYAEALKELKDGLDSLREWA